MRETSVFWAQKIKIISAELKFPTFSLYFFVLSTCQFFFKLFICFEEVFQLIN